MCQGEKPFSRKENSLSPMDTRVYRCNQMRCVKCP
nr:MAG TPA: hypothetical protein [Caudoviricetes sp.]